MNEQFNQFKEVTALFHTDGSLYIPPVELPRTQRQQGETYEQTYYRLCRNQGITGYVDYLIDLPQDDPDPNLFRATLMRPRHGELNNSPLLVPLDRVEAYLDTESDVQLVKSIDRRLVLAAKTLLTFKNR